MTTKWDDFRVKWSRSAENRVKNGLGYCFFFSERRSTQLCAQFRTKEGKVLPVVRDRYLGSIPISLICEQNTSGNEIWYHSDIYFHYGDAINVNINDATGNIEPVMILSPHTHTHTHRQDKGSRSTPGIQYGVFIQYGRKAKNNDGIMG